MGGSGFLRDIALRKQLEEKVKEAAKTRQLAEETITAARGLIDGAKKIDGNVTEAEKALADATAAISSKDYRAALERAQEASERGKRALAERARAVLESTRSHVTLAKAAGVDQGDALATLDRADESLAKESYDEAVNLANNAWKKIEKGLHEHLSSSFSTAQSLILIAKSRGKDTSAVEDLLSRARSAVESNDFEMALAFTNECLNTVGEDLKGEVDRATQEVTAGMQTVREMGGDVSNMQRLLDRAQADVTRREYDKAFNSLKQARSDAEKSLGKTLESRTSEFAKLLADAEALGADVTHPRSLHKEFEKAVKDGDIPKATALARDGYQALQKAQFDRVLAAMSASRDKFVAAKNVGADIAPALEWLNRSRAALQRSQYQEALSASKKADEAVEQILREYQTVEGEIRTLQRTFADAEVLGVDTGPARRLLDRGRAALGQRDFRAAVDQLRRSHDELERAQSDRAMEIIEKAEFLLTAGEKMGASLQDASGALEEAITAGKGKNFAKAMEMAARSRELTERSIHRALADSIQGLHGSLQFLGDDAVQVRGFLERAESALSARDFESAHGYVDEAMRLSEGRTKDRGLQFHELLRTTIQIGIQLGVDVTTLENGLKEANAGIDRGRYADVMALKEKLMREIGVVSENTFNLVKGKVVEAKNLQVDITEMREYLKRSKMALGVEDYPEALRLLSECNEKANKTVGLHKEVFNAISGAAALVAEAKKKEVNVSKVLEMLLEAKRAHEHFDHERALELAQRAKAETEKLMILYSSAQKIIGAREMLELVSRAGIDAPHLREILEKAKDAMKSKDYDKALEFSERGEREVRELMKERVSSILSSAEALVGSVEGANLLSQEEKLIKAREALDRGDLAQSIQLAVEARGEVESIKKKNEQSGVTVSRAQDLASELEAMNVSSAEGAALLEKAVAANRESRFDEAIASAEGSIARMEKDREEQVGTMITRFESSVQRSKKGGIDTRSAEKLIVRAREFLGEHKYRQALSFAMQAEGEVEKVSLQQDMASKAIATAEKKLNGFDYKIPDLQKMVSEAKRSLEEGDYVRALDFAIKTGEEFNHRREAYEDAVEIEKRVQEIREVAVNTGVDTFEMDALMARAQEALETGDPEPARDSYQRALDQALVGVKARLGEATEEARNLADVGRRLGGDMDTPYRKLSEAKALLEAEDFEGGAVLLGEATKAAREGTTRLVEEAIVAAQSNLDHSRKLGADVRRAEELLTKAREELDSAAYEAAFTAARESHEAVQMRLDTEKKFAERSFQAESTIRRAKKFGIDVLEAERVLAEAIRTKKSDFDSAMALAEKAYQTAEQAIESFAPSLTAKLDIRSPVAGNWADATLTITNEAKALAKDVRAKILGDAEVEGLKDIAAIKAKGTEVLPLRVKMNAGGQVPLAIQLKSQRILDGKEYATEVVATVDVVASAAQPEAQQFQAATESRCSMCKGLIKVGFTVKRCPNCGGDMHEPCFARAGQCPACGKPLGDPAKRKKIAFKVG
jgi:hypothetical protein